MSQNEVPAWMEVAIAESGQREIPGPRHNERILEYHRWTSLQASDDETPWCSAFVNWCMGKAGFAGTNSAAARSWLTWGQRIEPRYGCIAVLWRGSPASAQGHVGFYVGEDDGYISLLGGNQGDRVSIAKFPKTRVLAFRWPA